MAWAQSRKSYLNQSYAYDHRGLSLVERKAAVQTANVKAAVKAIKVAVIGLALAFLVVTSTGCDPNSVVSGVVREVNPTSVLIKGGQPNY